MGNWNMIGKPMCGQVDQVRLESAQHKAFIEVTEEGSVAAAATALLGFRSARPLIHTEFVANHPFLFLIYDKQVEKVVRCQALINVFQCASVQLCNRVKII